MANQAAFESGYQQGYDVLAQKRARKQALSDEELHQKIGDEIGKREAILQKLPTLQGPEKDQANNELTNIAHNLITLYHHENNPNAIEKFGHLLTDHIGLTTPLSRSQQDTAKKAKGWDAAQQKAQGWAQAAPLSPEQTSISTANANAAGQLYAIQAAVRNYKTLNPNATDEDVQAYQNDLIQRATTGSTSGNWENVSGKLNGQPATLLFDKKSRTYRTQDGNVLPSELLSTWVPDPKSTAQKLPKGLKYDASTGEVVNQDTQKRYSIDDIGKTGTPPEVKQMFNDAKRQMDDKQKNALELANQRGIAFGANRYTGFVDPNNPTQVIPATWGDAAKRGLHLATGAQYQTMEAMLKSSTSGPIGNEIAAFSTALSHADLLEQAAVDLNNGDLRAWNAVTNNLLTQFGDERPTDFQTIAGAYTREVTKALSANHITDTEIAQNGLTIPQDASLEQITGAVDRYKALMASKIQIRLQQIKAGMSGTPFLGAGAPQDNPNETPNPQQSKGLVSVTEAMKKPKYKKMTRDHVKQIITQAGYTPTEP